MLKLFVTKKYSHSRQYGNRINPLSIAIAILIALMWLLSPADYGDEIYKAEQLPITNQTRDISVNNQLTKKEIENKIKQYFPRSHKTMIAVAYAESGLNQEAKGWNCYYNKKETIVYSTKVKGSHSTACKVSHRIYAHSVDCNVLQRNVKGQICPKQTLDEHLKEVSELSKKQGLKAWSAYNNKSYLTYK